MRKLRFLPLLLILFISEAAQAQSASQLKEILEQFCLENYDNYYNPYRYVAGSLQITSITREGGVIKVEGTHANKGRHIPVLGRIMTYKDRKIYAEIWPHGAGYKVKFWREKKYEIDVIEHKWEGPCERLVIPD